MGPLLSYLTRSSKPSMPSTPLETSSKTIYFKAAGKITGASKGFVTGKDESIKIRPNDKPERIKDLFRGAADAGPYDIIKLFNTEGNIIKITKDIEPNSASTRYILAVVATIQIGNELGEMAPTVEELEKSIEDLDMNEPTASKELEKLRNDVKDLNSNFLHAHYRHWLRLFQPDSDPNSSKIKFLNISDIRMTEELREYLKKPHFDNWQWEHSEMILLIRQMFFDLDLVRKFDIDLCTLHLWLHNVYKNYHQVPFHNFNHCFMVSQMLYSLIWLIELQDKLNDEDILILLVAAICHDLDHPGVNNGFQEKAKTDLAKTYTDGSILENHHCAIALKLLNDPELNILKSLPADACSRVRDGVKQCILATDMAKHEEILATFKSCISNFDYDNEDHKAILLKILIKTADISNEVRPMPVAEPWVECLLEEFFHQSDRERKEGLQITPYMDRETVSKPKSQVWFIKTFLLPLFEALRELYPAIQDDVLTPVENAVQYYTDMQ